MSRPTSADLIVLNGTVRTLDPARPLTEAVAIRGDRIAAVGARETIEAWRSPQTEIFDLKGGCVVPAFTDAHCHLNAYGMSLTEIDCSPERAPRLEDILRLIQEAAVLTPPTEWVQARGYDDTRLVPPTHPTRWELDRVAPHVPVILRRRCGHVCVANTTALQLAGITRDSPPISGGAIDRDREGAPTGVLRERAQHAVRDLIPPPSDDALQQAILEAARRYLAQGYAAVHDAGGARPQELAAYRTLEAAGRLPLRVTLMVRDPLLEPLAAAGLNTGFGSDRLRIGPYKLFADGGVGPRTAAVSLPYRGTPENRGILWASPDELRDQVGKAVRAGFAVAGHAIGDVAIRQLLDTFEGAGRRSPFPHRVEHCSLPQADDVVRLARLQAAAVIQPMFLWSLGDSWLQNLDPRLHQRILPVRQLLEARVLCVSSSDCPVVPSDPLKAISVLVTRRTAGGERIAPEEGVDPESALHMYTDWPAHLLGEQDLRGRIREGMLADLTALEVDPVTANPADLTADLVTATIVGGQVLFRR